MPAAPASQRILQAHARPERLHHSICLKGKIQYEGREPLNEPRRTLMLFTDRSIWTMVHGIGLGGGALMGLAASVFYLHAARSPKATVDPPGAGPLAGATALSALVLWLTVIVGTYVIFPPYRATPPPGVADLSEFPRSMLLASPSTAWLHAFAMESKEHMPWIASMLTTAVAFVVARYRSRVLQNPSLRSLSMTLLAIAFALVAFVSLMGVFVNKVAPLD